MAVREAEPVGTLQEVKDAGLDREDLLGMYRNMLLTRGIEERGHILYKQGKIPGSFYTGRGNEASAVGVATAMGPNDVGTPLQRDMGVHVTRGIEPWRVFAQYMGRVDGPTAGPRRERPHGRLAARALRHGQPPARDAPGRGRHGARVHDPRGEARRGRLVRRGRVRARRRARGHEPRRRPPAAGRLRDRQQPVGVLDARPSRVRGRPPRRPRRRVRLRRRRRRRHRRARRLPRGEARDREGARGRRPDADRVRDAPDGGPRRPRRRLLRPEGAVRGVGAARPDRAVPRLAPRQRLAHRRRGGRDPRRRQAHPERGDPARGGVARSPTRPPCSTASSRRPRSSRRRTTSRRPTMAEKTYLQAI